MKAQDLKKQLLNVVGPVDFSQTPLELLQKFADAETDETLRRYFFTLQDEAKNNCPDTDSLKELHEAEHALPAHTDLFQRRNETRFQTLSDRRLSVP